MFPFDELGEWADRVTRGYQISGTTMMSEGSMARNRPDGGVATGRARTGERSATSAAPVKRSPARC